MLSYCLQERTGCVSSFRATDLDLEHGIVRIAKTSNKMTPRTHALQILWAAKAGMAWNRGYWTLPADGFFFTGNPGKIAGGGAGAPVSRMALQKVISASRKRMAANSGDVKFLRIRGRSGRGSAIKQHLKNGVTPETGCQLTGP